VTFFLKSDPENISSQIYDHSKRHLGFFFSSFEIHFLIRVLNERDVISGLNPIKVLGSYLGA